MVMLPSSRRCGPGGHDLAEDARRRVQRGFSAASAGRSRGGGSQAPGAQAGGGGSAGGSGRRCDLSGISAAEHWIILRESSGDPTADNPTSTAFGLGQLLLGNRILYLGRDYATIDCGRQLWAFRAHVRDRYGTAARAKAFWQANGWY
jgi:hypothetical protein